MKADLIYRLDPSDHYSRCPDALVAQNGKRVNVLGPCHQGHKVGSLIWGQTTPELRAEARELNALAEALSARQKAFDAKLIATQPTLIAAAKAAPKDPKAVPFHIDGALIV